MNMGTDKCVMVIEEGLGMGITANIAAILGMTLSKEIPEIVGIPVVDGSGHEHAGLIEIPLPILKASREHITELRTRLYDEEFSDLLVVDFSNVAQECNGYDKYTQTMNRTVKRDLSYLGIAITGSKKKINKLTGGLPLLR